MASKRKGGKTMDTTTWVLAAVAIALLVIAFGRGRDLPLVGLLAAWLAICDFSPRGCSLPGRG
jgi:hypothetical protein